MASRTAVFAFKSLVSPVATAAPLISARAAAVWSVSAPRAVPAAASALERRFLSATAVADHSDTHRAEKLERMAAQLHKQVSGLATADLMAALRQQFESLQPVNGFVEVAKLNTIPQFKMLVQDVEDVFDRDDDGLIDLHEFVFGMTFLNELASRVSRTTDYYDKFMFAMMDDDGNGVVEHHELETFLKAARALGVLRRNYGLDDDRKRLPDADLVQLMLKDFDCEGEDDTISFEAFRDIAHRIFDYRVFEALTVKDIE